MPTVKSHFSSHEVVVLTGFSKHMLDYLAREEIFAPSEWGIRGHKRKYMYEDVVLLRALNRICAGKGKIRHLKASLANFRRDFGGIRPGQSLNTVLFVEGDELCVRDGSDGGRELRSGQRMLGFYVDLSVVAQDLLDCVRPGPTSTTFYLIEEVERLAEEERMRVWEPIRARRKKAKDAEKRAATAAESGRLGKVQA